MRKAPRAASRPERLVAQLRTLRSVPALTFLRGSDLPSLSGQLFCFLLVLFVTVQLVVARDLAHAASNCDHGRQSENPSQFSHG